MRHDVHQIHSLVVRDRFELEAVHETPMGITRIRYAANDRDSDLLDADSAVEAIDRADQACGVT
jgi:hypothetical protein